MDKKIVIYFRRSLISILLTCTVLFLFMIFFMSQKTKESILDISDVYMSAINNQIQQKFSSILDLHTKQIDTIINQTPPDADIDRFQLFQSLRKHVENSPFIYLGFYSEQTGKTESVYGSVQFTNDNIQVNANHIIISRGFDKDGEPVLILGKHAEYPMADNQKSTSMLIAIPMSEVNESLFLYENADELYSHIIDSNGDFVIRNGNAYRDNYFTRIENIFLTYKGKTPKEYKEELQQAIADNTNYSATFQVSDGVKLLYCSRLYSTADWYVITVMPESLLGSTINKLDGIRILTITSVFFVIMLLMTGIIIWYYHFSQKQFIELTKTKQEAVYANNAKSEFLSSMSHDIRTPMNAIIGMTEIALKNQQNPTQVEECLQKIKLSSKHLLGLINDVLDMSKIESGKITLNMTPMSLKDAMDDIVNIIQPQVKSKNQYFDIFIKNIISEDVCCDNVRLNQVLLNLLSNALKFTPEAGRIDVYVCQEESPRGSEYVRTHFRVTDTGIGMSEEFQKKIFDTFSREENEVVRHITGTGLGMSISKSIVDLMGGTIQIQSTLNKGSSFHITLDLKKSTVNEHNMHLPPNWSILVVDDNEQLCTSAVSNLEELGVHAEWTLDGMHAVEMIEERHKRNDDYQFVLIDWKMPNMDGIQTISEIRNRVGSAIPIFLISAYDWNDISAESYPAELEGFISKPLFKSTLYARLSQYFENEPKTDEPIATEKVDFKGKRILLAEDIDINWEVAEILLSEVGFELERAENGKICVEKFNTSPLGYYDLILMDIRMPVMDGYDATKAIRALNREDNTLPIIAMTADAFSDDVQSCIEYGMNAHIAKPIDLQKCIDTLKGFLL